MLSAVRPSAAEARGSPSRRTIPYDYAFRYELTGTPKNILNATVTVSIEAPFVALSIGYGVIPELSPIKFPAVPSPTTPPTLLAALALVRGGVAVQPSLIKTFPTLIPLAQALGEASHLLQGLIGPKTAEALRNGIKLNLDLAKRSLLADPTKPLDPSLANELFQVVSPPPDRVQFLYAIFDEGSGRAFQDDPILNTAGLGSADGDRPFRYFAKPIVFAPRSTIRMQVTELSEFAGHLHVSLQGYRVLGGEGTPTGSLRQRVRRGGKR